LDVKTELGPVGVFLGSLALVDARSLRQAVTQIEQLGFRAIWGGESFGRDPFVQAAIVLEATERLIFATGIANIWVRDPTATMNAARALAEAYPDRFVLGLGVSHPPLVDTRGHHYDKPLTAMRDYLEALPRAPYRAPLPANPAPIVLAALGPKMLELARDRSAGAHPYFVPVEHTRQARQTLGPAPLLAPEQAVVVASDRASARDVGNAYMKTYLRLDNYRNNLVRLGWPEEELNVPGSDRCFDALVAWGDERAIAERINEHLGAGADHVAVSVLTPRPDAQLMVEQLRRLTPHLLRESAAPRPGI
jgi:probable F420-dependent oxidoreductase